MMLCKKCTITKSFANGENPPQIDYKSVNNTEKNEILLKILSKGIGPVDSQFTVISHNNRYRITVKHENSNHCLLIQEYMHFDKRNGYVPSNWRYVRIVY